MLLDVITVVRICVYVDWAAIAFAACLVTQFASVPHWLIRVRMLANSFKDNEPHAWMFLFYFSTFCLVQFNVRKISKSYMEFMNCPLTAKSVFTRLGMSMNCVWSKMGCSCLPICKGKLPNNPHKRASDLTAKCKPYTKKPLTFGR